MSESQHIRIAQTGETDALQAARAFQAFVAQPEMGLVIFFCSSAYDLNVLGDEIHRLFGDTAVIGCTTAGEIGPARYSERGLTGASLAREACTAVTQRLAACMAGTSPCRARWERGRRSG